MKAGKIVAVRKIGKSVTEWLSRNVGPITFEIVQIYVDYVVLVNEETLKKAVYLLRTHDKQIVEGSGAAAIVPVIENRPLFKDRHVVSVITGGNIDNDLFQRIRKAQK